MNKFKFYEAVKVASIDPELEEINAKEGVVIGMAGDENDEWSYTVSIKNESECWSIDEADLVSLNSFAKEEDFHTGESMKVVVTPDGKGSIKDE